MNLGISFAPLVPDVLVWAALGVAILLTVLLLASRSRGALIRAAAMALFVLALANPSLTREDRDPLSSIAIVVVDKSASQEFGDRTIVSPYVALLHSAHQTYYYFPDMEPDESLVFVGLHLDTSRKMGCAHCAFRHPTPGDVSVPRRSIETRVLAFF